MTRLTLAITISLFFAISPDRNAYSNEKDELPVLDKQAPDFILTDADNKYYELKEMAGSYVFMLFGNRSLSVTAAGNFPSSSRFKVSSSGRLAPDSFPTL